MLSVIIPANNEEAYLGACLDGLAAQSLDPARTGGAEIVVAANGCTDRTVAIAESYRDRFAARGWRLVVLDIPEGGKPGALNRADATAAPLGETGIRAYLAALQPQVQAPGMEGVGIAAAMRADTPAAVEAMLRENPHPTREQINRNMSGNLCRCTGYKKIVEAIEDVIAKGVYEK